MEDNELCKRIIYFNDRNSAEILVKKYYDEIYAYVSKQLYYSLDADDITQDIFINILRCIKSYKKEKSSFRTWLYRVSTNRVIDYLRMLQVHNKYISELPEDYLLIEGNDTQFEELLEKTDYANKLMSKLNIDEEKIVRMKIYGDYTFYEIAACYGVAESTVKTRYYAALRKMREE